MILALYVIAEGCFTRFLALAISSLRCDSPLFSVRRSTQVSYQAMSLTPSFILDIAFLSCHVCVDLTIMLLAECIDTYVIHH